MNVFLSHSTRDKAFALKLSAGLESDGFTPWLCEISIDPATNWVQEIENGLRQADLVLLLWSPDAAQSAATRDEWTSAWDREITERRLRLGVVMLKKHPLPELIRTKQYIDATQNDERAIGRVLQWLKDRRDAGRGAGREAPVYLPDYRPQNFVGRQEHFKKLRSALIENEGMLLLNGEPGSGKSTLALMFAWEAQQEFDAVIFQVCGQRSTDVVAGEMAEQLKGPLGEGIIQLAPEKKLRLMQDWMKQRRSLLILDDVWLDSAVGQTAASLRGLLPGPPVSVLFTSRWANMPGLRPNQMLLPSQILRVESFTEPEAEAVFTSFLGAETVGRHRDALLEFARRVERLPIAVTVGAELLRSQFGPLNEAARSLALEKLRDEVHDVPGLFQRAIEAQGENEQRLLRAASVCAADGFFLPLAVDIAGLSNPQGAAARDRLVNASLLRVLDRERQRFQLHGLLREQLRTAADPLAASQAAHAAALERLFKDWETRWRDCSECFQEVIPAAEFLWNSEQRYRGTQLCYCGYACASRTGEMELALRFEQQKEKFWASRIDHEAREGKDGLSRSYGNQALILQAWGRLEEAMALHRKEEAICLELNDKDGLQASYGNQAMILQAWGRLEEALTLLKKEEAICLELDNKNGLQACYGNQALILKDWGRLEEALALHKKEEAICLELGNKDGLQRSYGNQALILQSWGRLEEALALHKKEEAICLDLGNKDGLQRSYGNQAVILQAWGRLEEALDLLKKQEGICLELGNRDGLQISYCNQAIILRARERLEEALALYKKQEIICVELGNKDGLQRSYNNQALIYKDLGLKGEALALFKKQEKICLEVGIRRDLGYCYWGWGLLAQKQSDHKTAKEKLQAALAIFTELQMPRERDAVQKALDKQKPQE